MCCKSNCNTENIYQIQLKNKNIKVNFLIFNVSYRNASDILFLNWNDFAPKRTFGRSGDFLIVISGRKMLLASKNPTMHRTALSPTLTKNYSARNVKSAEAKKPCSRINNIKLFITFSKCLILHTAFWTSKRNPKLSP